MTTDEPLSVIAWKALLIVLVAVALLSIVSANWPMEPATWSLPSRAGNPFVGPVLRMA